MTRRHVIATSGVGMASILAVLVLLQFLAGSSRNSFSAAPDPALAAIAAPVAAIPALQAGAGRTQVGGISRSNSDVAKQRSGHLQRSGTESLPEADASNGRHGYGWTPSVNPKTNATVKSASDKLTEASAKHKQSYFSARSFDRSAYNENPTTYLEEFDPMRVFHPAQPGEGVPVLKRKSLKRSSLKQGESIRLQVKAPANAPVTFTSFDGGLFDNLLNSISVQADETGVGQANFFASPGTIASVRVVAASPLATGVVDYQINVESPAR